MTNTCHFDRTWGSPFQRSSHSASFEIAFNRPNTEPVGTFCDTGFLDNRCWFTSVLQGSIRSEGPAVVQNMASYFQIGLLVFVCASAVQGTFPAHTPEAQNTLLISAAPCQSMLTQNSLCSADAILISPAPLTSISCISCFR